MNLSRVYAMKFSTVYPLYVQKVAKKGRTKQELDEVIHWLTGYTAAGLKTHVDGETSLEEFFAKAPKFNPHAKLITGVVCGIRVENVAEPLMRKIRYLDKLVDELAKGKAMDKILRKPEG